MKIFQNLIIFFLLSIFSVSNVFSIPATPFPVIITQSDGSQISIRLHGDEYFSYKTTLDGYLLSADNSGILNYAQLDSDGKLINTNIKANDILKRTDLEKNFVKTLNQNTDFSKMILKNRVLRSKNMISASGPQKSYPLSGSPKAIVILVNFSDVKFVTSVPQTAFTNLLNQSGYSANGGTGSAKDYFHDASMGVFNPQFDVIGPVTLDHDMAYYGANSGGTAGQDSNPQQMVIDACTKASSLVDLSQYDTDKNGVVDNIFIYYAGYNEAEGGPANSVWPHKWNLNNYNTKLNGVSIFNYACTSELHGNSGNNMCGIGTFCHEFGHVLGLDDYYVTSSSAVDHHTLSVWNIMDYGAYLNLGRTPPTYSAYDRFFLKWMSPTELKTAGDYSLDYLGTSNKAYLISQSGNRNLTANDASSPEYFTLENRQQTGWDKYLPGHGLIIYHIYYNQSTWLTNTPNDDANAMGVDIVEADGGALTETSSLDPSLSGDPYPGTSNVTSFNPKLRSGIVLAKPLTVIKESNGIITFKFMGGSKSPTIITSGTPTTFNTVQGTPSGIQTITVSGLKLKSNVLINFVIGSHFEIKKDTEVLWGKSVILTPIDSTLTNIKIQIRYNPSIPSFSNPHTETLNLSSVNAETIGINLTGISMRKIFIIPPIAKPATNTQLDNFVANWSVVSDSIGKFASGYYLTVYNISNGSNEMKQDFSSGLIAPMGWSINATAISSTKAYCGNAVPAIQFGNSGEYIQTEKYMLPASNISFYLKSINESNGKLLVEAWNGVNWNTVENISITSTLANVKSYTFDTISHYNQFRFTFTKNTGYLTFDDWSVKFAKKIEFNALNLWVQDSSKVISNIIPLRDYYYLVKASDKSLYSDGTLKYENITNYSNSIHVYLTSKGIIHFVNNDQSLQVFRNNSGKTILQIPDTDSVIKIYNVMGQLIETINPNSLAVPLNNLKTGQFYIIQAGNSCVKTVIP